MRIKSLSNGMVVDVDHVSVSAAAVVAAADDDDYDSVYLVDDSNCYCCPFALLCYFPSSPDADAVAVVAVLDVMMSLWTRS